MSQDISEEVAADFGRPITAEEVAGGFLVGLPIPPDVRKAADVLKTGAYGTSSPKSAPKAELK